MDVVSHEYTYWMLGSGKCYRVRRLESRKYELKHQKKGQSSRGSACRRETNCSIACGWKRRSRWDLERAGVALGQELKSKHIEKLRKNIEWGTKLSKCLQSERCCNEREMLRDNMSMVKGFFISAWEGRRAYWVIWTGCGLQKTMLVSRKRFLLGCFESNFQKTLDLR